MSRDWIFSCFGWEGCGYRGGRQCPLLLLLLQSVYHVQEGKKNVEKCAFTFVTEGLKEMSKRGWEDGKEKKMGAKKNCGQSGN